MVRVVVRHCPNVAEEVATTPQEGKTLKPDRQVYGKVLQSAALARLDGNPFGRTDLKVRAARKGGAKLIEMAESGERFKSGRHTNGSMALPLDSLGVTKTHSSRWQKLALMDDVTFEAKLASILKKEITACDSAVAREMKEAARARKPMRRPISGKSATRLMSNASAA
jgi:hypothetical protein